MLVENRWQIRENKWGTVWKLQAPQRVKSFLWLVLRGSILTNAERYRRHMTEDAACSTRLHPEEDWIHILWNRVEAQSIWSQFVPQHEVANFFTMAKDDWLVQNLSDHWLSQEGYQWSTLFEITCWLLWKWRNMRIF